MNMKKKKKNHNANILRSFDRIWTASRTRISRIIATKNMKNKNYLYLYRVSKSRSGKPFHWTWNKINLGKVAMMTNVTQILWINSVVFTVHVCLPTYNVHTGILIEKHLYNMLVKRKKEKKLNAWKWYR